MYERAKFRLMLTMAISFFAAGCAPTYAPHVDMPTMSAPDLESATMPSMSVLDLQSEMHCTSTEKTEKKKLAALDPPPVLPDAKQSPCPLGSGLAACFTLDQDLVRQQRFKILHDDRDYCRDAYDRAAGTSARPTGSEP
jgi:hypothetical protein